MDEIKAIVAELEERYGRPHQPTFPTRIELDEFTTREDIAEKHINDDKAEKLQSMATSVKMRGQKPRHEFLKWNEYYYHKWENE